MPDTLTLLDTRYTLAEAAILSDPWPFAATSDVLAKSDIVIQEWWRLSGRHPELK